MASITKRNNGWRVQIRRPGKKPIYGQFDTKRAAETYARRIEREIDDGRAGTYREMTIAAVIDACAEEAGGLEALPRSQATSFRHLRRLTGGVGVGVLGVKEVKAFARARKAEGAGPATILMDVTYLSGLLTYAATTHGTRSRTDMMKEARKELRRLRLTAKSREVERLPGQSELERLLAHFEAMEAEGRCRLPMTAILQVAQATGMRPSEFERAQWSGLDEANAVLTVRRKHPQGPRSKDIPLVPHNGVDPLAVISSLPRHSTYIFDCRAGTIGAAFRRACKTLGIRGLRLYDLRHHAATSLARRRDLKMNEAMMITGHTDPKMFLRYVHIRAAEVAGRFRNREPDG
ncbi:MAG: tyrosine-type recombinase/integrase [Alphaproteobacteria bacterium]|jgi:integrase|nr:tyrosine-type recombinase/integrase [Alphaproteobacteria bacterium]